jgi:hypothetical protein
MNKSTLFTSSFCGVVVTTLLASSAQAQEAQVETIIDSVAQQQPIPINVVSGKASAIHFQNEQSISYLILSDRSKIVYSLNAPPDSGEARSIFLRQIQPLSFPGQTTSSQPNLHVVAIDERGRQKNYEFVISNSPENKTKINIIPEKIVESKPENVIYTALGAANPYDVLSGLKHKLHKGEISPDSPIVLYAHEAITTTLNSEKTLLDVAGEFQVPLSVLAEFGRVGLLEKAKARRLQARQIHSTKVKIVSQPFSETRQSRQSRIYPNNGQQTIDTELGAATLDDFKFGLAVLRKRNQISEEEARSLKQAIQGNLVEQNETVTTEIRKIAKIGLAFETRLRLRGTIN